MWDADEPALWQKDLTGYIDHWIEVGQPDEKRLLRASARVGRVSVYSFSSSTETWWKGIENKLTRARNLTVWQIPAAQSEALSHPGAADHGVAGDRAGRRDLGGRRRAFHRSVARAALRRPEQRVPRASAGRPWLSRERRFVSRGNQSVAGESRRALGQYGLLHRAAPALPRAPAAGWHHVAQRAGALPRRPRDRHRR